MNRDEIAKQIAANTRSIEEAQRVKEQIDRTLRDSAQRTERAREFLRRAGYLRRPY
ncbi:MAG TPA: hypothetical protein VFI17_14285 [Solirubrobacterales bacterium]|nr:hypothetical protein [Solirubrobacterales bacterium]